MENVNITSQSSEDVNTKTAQLQGSFQWTLSWLVDENVTQKILSETIGQHNRQSKKKAGINYSKLLN